MDHLLGPLGGDAQFHDRDRRRVRGEDRRRVDDVLVERGEHGDLDLLVLGHRLDDELPVGELGEIGRERQVADRLVAFCLRQLAGRQATVE